MSRIYYRRGYRYPRRQARSAYSPQPPPTPEELARRDKLEAKRQESVRRMRFRNYATAASTVVGSIAIPAFSGEWSSIVGTAFLLGIGTFIVVHIIGLIFESRPFASLLWLPLFAALAVSVLASDFDRTRSVTWHVRTGAIAWDGFVSDATGSGACSHHGGVRQWLTRPFTRTLNVDERWQRVFGDYWLLLPFLTAIPVVFAERFALGRRASSETPENA